MKYRELGKTGFNVSEISLGTWQVGGKWGSGFDHALAERILHTAADQGVNFFDTADVYENGESEKAIGRFLKSRSERLYVGTKCGRRLNPHIAEAYTPDALRGFVEGSLKRLDLDTIDLIQLHCPPTEVYYRPEIFALFERLKEEGKIRHLGVSVEKVEEAIKAIEFENVATVQIIFNIFRQRPADLFFKLAKMRNVGVIVRVPLASGLLSGKYTGQTTFAETDHRHFNRDGAAFDKGETFSGVDYEKGLEAVEKIRAVLGNPENMAPSALKWILRYPEVGCIIPGASKPEQVLSNCLAGEIADLTDAQLEQIQRVYDAMIKPAVHHVW